MDIKLYEKNAKIHTDKQLELLAKIVAEIGWRQSVEVNQEGVIVVGHGRYLAWQKFKDKYRLPDVWIIDDTGKTIMGKHDERPLTEQQERMWRLADNQVNAMTGLDMKLAIPELKLLDDEMLDLTGFDKDLIIEPDDKDDEVPEVPEEPKSKLGDLYELGNHRVLCGDSTKVEDVEKLMEGALSDMIHTDPPYNVDYGVSKNPRHKIRTIENDKQSPEQWEDFCKKLFEIFKKYNKGDVYMWGASGPEGMRMRLWLVESGCHWSTTIIWKKDRLVLTPANYQRMYEPCFYGWFGKSTWKGGRKEVEVWDLKRPSDSKLHPTMKPIELCSKAIINSSKERDIVLDLFLGSGSTLIAAEKTGRYCYGIELDPKYIDVIVQRYVDYTGNNKIKKNGKEINW